MLASKLSSSVGNNSTSSNYIEDVFSTWLYTGTGSAQTITNGIDVSTNGGMVWIKCRNVSGESHVLVDSARGATRALRSNGTDAEVNDAGRVSAFTTSGFTIGTDGELNGTGNTHASWTFRKQPKFFDVVTYTGNGDSNRNIAHNLGSAPGCIIVKETDAANGWAVYHRTLDDGYALQLQSTGAQANTNFFGPNSAQTATTFQTGSANITYTNGTDKTYVAYLFAHDAGGFGLTGTDNVISCGSFTTDGSGNATVNLGYEPQFWLYKPNLAARYWQIYDTMRGWSQTQIANLAPNRSDAEGGGAATLFYPTATGFECTGGALDASTQHIYIAIRRGPMKVPTDATTVFSAVSRSGTGSTASVTGAGFSPDLVIDKVTNLNGTAAFWDKLRGPNIVLTPTTTDTESSTTEELTSFNQDGFSVGTSPNYYINASGGYTYINWQLKRAPSFFDEVCYTGTGSATTFSHNLAAVPELMICKKRNTSAAWVVYSAATGNSAILQLEDTGAVQTGVSNWNNTTPTSSVFSVGTQGNVNSGSHVMYLFATCAGVSKVGSYTGTGTLTTINCGFTSGARFVLIKRTDATGAWYVWDTVRGMVSGTDPSVRLNSIGSQSNADSVYSISTGFQLLASPAVDVNTSGGSYIFLAIA